MAFGLLFLLFIATFIYSISRSSKKLKTFLFTLGAMIAAVALSIAAVMLYFSAHGLSQHDSGYAAGVTAGPVSSLAGIITSLIYSSKTRPKKLNETRN
jgi:Kef-type K+ transport system membrane component KefB